MISCLVVVSVLLSGVAAVTVMMTVAEARDIEPISVGMEVGKTGGNKRLLLLLAAELNPLLADSVYCEFADLLSK